MKAKQPLLSALLLAPLAALCAIDPQGTEAGTPCEAAIGFESFRLGGVFERRVESMMKGNLLRLDMEKDFLGPFRKRSTSKQPYIGLGKTLDAGVHFAALTGNAEIIAWKNKWIAETIGTMDTDGYLGISPRGQTTLSVDYDANGTEQTKEKKTEGTTRKAGEIVLGNSGEIRSQTFSLKDARFEKGVRPDKADFSLTPAKPADFVIFGAYLRKNT